MSDIVERLNDHCVGHPYSKIEWPHRLLHDARNEINRLRTIEKAARDYYLGYAQDEADDAECCIVETQHEHAKALRDALGEK